jgi:hypothetical protein
VLFPSDLLAGAEFLRPLPDEVCALESDRELLWVGPVAERPCDDRCRVLLPPAFGCDCLAGAFSACEDRCLLLLLVRCCVCRTAVSAFLVDACLFRSFETPAWDRRDDLPFVERLLRCASVVPTARSRSTARWTFPLLSASSLTRFALRLTSRTSAFRRKSDGFTGPARLRSPFFRPVLFFCRLPFEPE